jgi:hypothetical protein
MDTNAAINVATGNELYNHRFMYQFLVGVQETFEVEEPSVSTSSSETCAPKSMYVGTIAF